MGPPRLLPYRRSRAGQATARKMFHRLHVDESNPAVDGRSNPAVDGRSNPAVDGRSNPAVDGRRRRGRHAHAGPRRPAGKVHTGEHKTSHGHGPAGRSHEAWLRVRFASMKVAVVKETAPGERRGALVPDAVTKLRAAGPDR